MTTTTTTIGTLSKEDVAALRMATAVTFHYFRGFSFIRAHLDPIGQPFTRREQILFPEKYAGSRNQSREIPVSSSVTGYTARGGTWRVDPEDTQAAAFYMIHSAQYAETWSTVAALLTTGQVVSLRWIADNNTDVLRDAGLHADELRLKTSYTSITDKRTRVFHIGAQVSPDNSARMIRRNGI